MNKLLIAVCVWMVIAGVHPRPTETGADAKKVDVCENLTINDSLDGLFHQYKTAHNKLYASEAEHEERSQIFLENAKQIIAHNDRFRRGETTFTMGCNAFADKRPNELHFGYRPLPSPEEH